VVLRPPLSAPREGDAGVLGAIHLTRAMAKLPSALRDSAIGPAEQVSPQNPSIFPLAPVPASAPLGLRGVPSELTAGQGVSPRAFFPRYTPRDSTDSRCRGDFPLFMLKRKFHFPVSDERFPFGLEKPLPPRHPVEGCKHAPKQQILLPASAFPFPPKNLASPRPALPWRRTHQLTGDSPVDQGHVYRSSMFLPQFLRI